MAKAKAAGKAISKEDGYIAATAFAHGLTVATRDVSPFRASGLTVINPKFRKYRRKSLILLESTCL